ncbi:MAG: hypothetical protein JJT96_01115 [Opitutales bacterium]|nr:hypothetical protein [Opitutales bacterium]
MNRPFRRLLVPAALFLSAVLWLPAAQVSRTSGEILLRGDFNGDGVADIALVDLNAGGLRIGFGFFDGGFSWVNLASGLPSVEDAAVGKIDFPDRDQIILASATGNRIRVLTPGASGVPEPPRDIFVPGIGPGTVALPQLGPFPSGALADFAVGTTKDGIGTVPRLHFVRNADPATLLASADLPVPPERLRIYQPRTSDLPRLGFTYFTETGGFFRLINSGGLPPFSTHFEISGLAPGTEVLSGFFRSDATNATFLFFVPGDSGFVARLAVFLSGQYLLFPPTFMDLEVAIERLEVIGAPGQQRLAAFLADGSVRFYHFEGAPSSAPELLGTFTPPPGERYLHAFPVWGAPDNLELLAGSSGVSTRLEAYTRAPDGTYSLARSDALVPPMARSGASTLLLFTSDPFASLNASLRARLAAGDWTLAAAVGVSPNQAVADVALFGDAASGLVEAGTVTFARPADALFALPNQLRPDVSAFSLDSADGALRGEATLQPDGGHFRSSVRASLQFRDPADAGIGELLYRIGPSQPWQPYSGPFVVGETARVEWLWRDVANLEASAIRQADFIIEQAPWEADCNGDGIPDFVRSALGLDPCGPADSDGNGVSDFLEILLGAEPADLLDPDFPFPAPAPGEFAPPRPTGVNDLSQFDLAVTPISTTGQPGFPPALALSLNGVATEDTFGTVVSVRDLNGRLVGRPGGVPDFGGTAPTFIETRAQGLPGVPDPSALITRLGSNDPRRFLVVTTGTRFEIDFTSPDPARGRELLGFVPLPRLQPAEIAYTFEGRPPAEEAAAWIAAARAAYAAIENELVATTLSWETTLSALLAEYIMGRLLHERGVLPAPTLTLTPFRTSETSVEPDFEIFPEPDYIDLRVGFEVEPLTLLSLEEPDDSGQAYRLHAILGYVADRLADPTDSGAQALRQLAAAVYQASARELHGRPLEFRSPIDVLREFFWSGELDEPYAEAATLSPANIAAAIVAREGFVDGVGGSARPFETVTARFVEGNLLAACPGDLVDHLTGEPLNLVTPTGRRYVIPATLVPPPGSLLSITGFTDALPGSCPGRPLEPFLIRLVHLALGGEARDDLIPPSWTRLFFVEGADPFADLDGDGYSVLQEFLAGTDPTDPLSLPADPPVDLGPPPVVIEEAGGVHTYTFRFPYPGLYASRTAFRLFVSSDLVNFVDTGFHAAHAGDDTWQLTLDLSAYPGPLFAFFRMEFR